MNRRCWIVWCCGLAAAMAVAGCGVQTGVAPQNRVDLGDGIVLEMVLISPGTFSMGDGQGLDDERPVHDVAVTRPFYLGQHEVTVGQFRRFVEATGYKTDAERGTGFAGAFGWNRDRMQFTMNEKFSWHNTGFSQSDTHPVVNVSWNDAIAFCQWLSHKEGKTYRLPTEAEWEYAARAGTKTRYWCGSDPEGLAKVGNVADAAFASQFPELKGLIRADDGYAYTAPVGSFLPNAYRLYDIHGNVWEWCADWYDATYYGKSPRNDPSGPASGEERVYRGGGWFNCTRDFRSASRSAALPENRNLALGFRVAATLP